VDVREKIVEFCPEVQGPCVGDGCAAFHSGMVVTVTDACKFVKKVCGEDISVPITFTLDVQICSKYETFVDKSSLVLYKNFIKEFDVS